MTAAVTEAITTEFKWRIAKLPRMTSMANSIPAIGALKVAPIPAPAPAATKLRTWSSPSPEYRPMDDPIAAPTITVGPSLPADPPLPKVRAVDAILR